LSTFPSIFERLLTFGLWIVQRKVEIRKFADLALWDIHANNFSVTKFSIIRNSFKVVVTDTPFFVRGFSSSVSRSRSILGWFSTQNVFLTLDHKLVLNVPETLFASYKILTIPLDNQTKRRNEFCYDLLKLK